MRRIIGAALAAGVLGGTVGLAAGARAQGRFEGGPRQGAKTLSLSGSVTGGDIPTVGGLNAQAGVYVRDTTEAGVAVGLLFKNPGESSASGTVGGFVKYHIPTRSRAIPYVGAGAGIVFGRFAGTRRNALLVDGTVGEDFFVSPVQSFFLEFKLQQPLRGSSTLYNTNFGVRFFFR